MEPKGAFTAQAALPEYRGLPEPEWLKEERHALSRKMMGKLRDAVRSSAPSPPRPRPDGKKTSGVTNTGMGFQMWRDSEGRDYVYFPDHPINEQIKKKGSGFEKTPDEGRKYGRAFRDG